MSDEGVSVREVAEALVCLAKLISLLDKLGIFGDFVELLTELEDELLDYQQEMR